MNKTPRTTSYFTTTDGAQIYYEVYGESGPVVVLTYGIACLINHWHRQVEELSKDYQVMVYDIRGHHKSSRGTDEITMELLANDLLNLASFAFPKEESFHFCGHSFGAPIVLCASALKTEKVKTSTLINGFYKNPFEEYTSTEMAVKIFEGLEVFAKSAPCLTSWLWKNTVKSLAFHYLACLLGGFNIERIDHKDIEIYSQGLAILNLDYFFEHFKALLRFDGSIYLDGLDTKTLIIHGDRDGIIPLIQNKILADKLKNSKLVLLREGSHCTQLDLYFEVNNLLKEQFRA